jgi:hypothetical protein
MKIYDFCFGQNAPDDVPVNSERGCARHGHHHGHFGAGDGAAEDLRASALRETKSERINRAR